MTPPSLSPKNEKKMSVKRCVQDIIINVKRKCSWLECTACTQTRYDVRARCECLYLLFCDDCFRCHINTRGKVCNWCHGTFKIDGLIQESFTADLTALSFGCARVIANHFKEVGISYEQFLPNFCGIMIQLKFAMDGEDENGELIQSDFIYEVSKETKKTKTEARKLLDTFVLSNSGPILTTDDKLLFVSLFRSRVLAILSTPLLNEATVPPPPPSPVLTTTNTAFDLDH